MSRKKIKSRLRYGIFILAYNVASTLIAAYEPDTARATLEPLLTHANPAEREAASISYIQIAVDDLAVLRKFLRTGDIDTRVRAAARILELTR